MSGERTTKHETVDAFNAACPIGTPVLAFPGSRDGRALMTTTRSTAWLVGVEPVVMVEGYAGGIALTHVEVLPNVSAPDPTAGERRTMCSGGCGTALRVLPRLDGSPGALMTCDGADCPGNLQRGRPASLTGGDDALDAAVEVRVDVAAATKARAEGAAQVRDDIRARRREFKRLGADEQYLSALDDAFGLAANRALLPRDDAAGAGGAE